VIDPYLAALVRAVEDGATSPPLWMTLVSGDRVTGTPRPARTFVDGTFQALIRRYDSSKEAMRAKGDERRALVEAAASKGITPFNVPLEPNTLEAVTLEDVTLQWGGRDDGARMPVIRVHLSAVALWWIAGGKPFKGGPMAFVGLSVPLDQ